jgi:uncharacterized protein YciI
VPVYHVRFTCAQDYMARRLPFRPAHLAQLVGLRDDGRVIAGGPEPDGGAAHIFYRLDGPAALDALLADNVFYCAKLFVAHDVRAFTDALLPLAPLPADAGLQVMLVEGSVSDWPRASAALAALQHQERVGFGGRFADGTALAAVRTPKAAEAVEWLTREGTFAAAPTTRAWSQTL